MLPSTTSGFRPTPAPSLETGFVEDWQSVFGKENCTGGVEEITLKPVKARYVKLWIPEQNDGLPEGIGLTEFEVYGTGGPVIKPAPLPPPAKDGTWDLCGGWKLISQKYVADDAVRISTSGYDDSQWLPATVPGTILASYLNIDAIPDPWYADQNSQISDWFCRTNWWYRNEIEIPESYRGKRIWLNLDGINYRADIFVNGAEVGKMAGAFIRGRYDITDKGRQRQECHCRAHPAVTHRAGTLRQTARQGLDRRIDHRQRPDISCCRRLGLGSVHA